MATMTFDSIGKHDGKMRAKGFARRFMDRYVDAQMKKARLRVNAYLQRLNDEALGKLGYTPAEIQAIRASDASVGLMI